MFFFQAEDGIRDLAVTGVQTCALPISITRVPLKPTASPRTRCVGLSGSRVIVPRSGCCAIVRFVVSQLRCEPSARTGVSRMFAPMHHALRIPQTVLDCTKGLYRFA